MTHDSNGLTFVILLSKPITTIFQYLLLALYPDEYTLQGKRGVWIKVPIGLAYLVEIAVKVISTFVWTFWNDEQSKFEKT